MVIPIATPQKLYVTQKHSKQPTSAFEPLS